MKEKESHSQPQMSSLAFQIGEDNTAQQAYYMDSYFMTRFSLNFIRQFSFLK